MTASIPQLHALQDLINQFIELYPNRGGSLVKHETGTWREVSRYYDLPNDEIVRSITSMQTLVRAVNWDSRTKFTVLNVDAGSKHHNQLALWQLQNCLGQRGIHKTRIYQSSESNGWHIYIFWNDWVGSTRSARVISAILAGAGFEVAPGSLDVFPSANSLRLPLQAGFAWLNESGRIIVRRSEISLEGALALFLDDVVKFSNEASWLDSDYATEVASLHPQAADKTDHVHRSLVVEMIEQAQPVACADESSTNQENVPFAEPLIANPDATEEETDASELTEIAQHQLTDFDETQQYQDLPAQSQDSTDSIDLENETVVADFDETATYQNFSPQNQYSFTEADNQYDYPDAVEQVMQISPSITSGEDANENYYYVAPTLSNEQTDNVVAFPVSAETIDRFLTEHGDNTAEPYDIDCESQQLSLQLVDASNDNQFQQQPSELAPMASASGESFDAQPTHNEAAPVLDFSPQPSVVPLRASGIVRELIEEEIPEIAFDAEPSSAEHSENNGWAGAVQSHPKPVLDDSLTNGKQRLNNVINSGSADIPRRKRPARNVTRERPSPGRPPSMP